MVQKSIRYLRHSLWCFLSIFSSLVSNKSKTSRQKVNNATKRKTNGGEASTQATRPKSQCTEYFRLTRCVQWQSHLMQLSTRWWEVALLNPPPNCLNQDMRVRVGEVWWRGGCVISAWSEKLLFRKSKCFAFSRHQPPSQESNAHHICTCCTVYVGNNKIKNEKKKHQSLKNLGWIQTLPVNLDSSPPEGKSQWNHSSRFPSSCVWQVFAGSCSHWVVIHWPQHHAASFTDRINTCGCPTMTCTWRYQLPINQFYTYWPWHQPLICLQEFMSMNFGLTPHDITVFSSHALLITSLLYNVITPRPYEPETHRFFLVKPESRRFRSSPCSFVEVFDVFRHIYAES